MKQRRYNGLLLAFLTKFMQVIVMLTLQSTSFFLVSTSDNLFRIFHILLVYSILLTIEDLKGIKSSDLDGPIFSLWTSL